MKKPKKILLLGSGGLKIGQAGEFDYSGTQAIKAFKEEGVTVVLMNPNIATVQTDNGLADKVYFLPLTEKYAIEIIEKEHPDAIALSFGGQTALNLGLALDEKGILKKYGVRVLGTPVETIRDTEDRNRFVKRLTEIGIKTAHSIAVRNVEGGMKAAEQIGFPVMIRSGFALGGQGSGVVQNSHELGAMLKEAFANTPQVLIEECLSGWKEIEYEVVRDANDNCITVCNMENLDPMGIHTGESIVVAPSQTLSNTEYHMLREIAIKTIRHLGIVGECNIQYALDPHSNEYRVIEVNARLSRSSALASKATGYPLASVAAKISLGYTLAELKNSVTNTTACFEPALDYIVLKMPRWDLAKFENATEYIGTEMKSVGEVMAIGRSFEEVLQKAIRMLNIGAYGLTAQKNGAFEVSDYEREIKHATTRRIFAIAEAIKKDVPVEKIHEWSRIDPWFLHKLHRIITFEKDLKKKILSPILLRNAKRLGFSDAQIAIVKKTTEKEVRALRKKHKITPVIKQIDTLAGEFPAQTNYLYLTYHGTENDIEPSVRERWAQNQMHGEAARSRDAKRTGEYDERHDDETTKPGADCAPIAVLGSGPYCIGSSVEFDWSCVQALSTLKTKEVSTIMINSNPETVSTDYDMSDRLYFEEISLERVLDIVEFENPKGIVISTGGQIPNNLALKLLESKVPILGTSPNDINRAEDRHLFSKLLDTLAIDQPAWVEVATPSQAIKVAEKMGYPVLVRPSYVLSGAAMNVAIDRESLEKFLKQAADVSTDHPVVVSKFIENAREIEIDGVAQKGELVIYAISEHVENAGLHSGDATVVLPPQRTYLETIRRAKHITKQIIHALNITGPFNMQFIAKDNHLMVIECNVRASRSFPFVSKVTGYNFIDIATRAQLGEDVSGNYQTVDLDQVGVKSPQFSYARIKGADPRSGVEMASTGEVACIGNSYGEALLDSMQAAGFRLPKKNILVSLGKEENKIKLLPSMRMLADQGFVLYATEHTADFLKNNNVPCEKVYKLNTDKKPNVSDLLGGGTLDLIINIPTHAYEKENTDGKTIRRTAVDMNIPLITNRQLAEAFVTALAERK